jgi:hypothetical protein
MISFFYSREKGLKYPNVSFPAVAIISQHGPKIQQAERCAACRLKTDKLPSALLPPTREFHQSMKGRKNCATPPANLFASDGALAVIFSLPF